MRSQRSPSLLWQVCPLRVDRANPVPGSPRPRPLARPPACPPAHRPCEGLALSAQGVLNALGWTRGAHLVLAKCMGSQLPLKPQATGQRHALKRSLSMGTPATFPGPLGGPPTGKEANSKHLASGGGGVVMHPGELLLIALKAFRVRHGRATQPAQGHRTMLSICQALYRMTFKEKLSQPLFC